MSPAAEDSPVAKRFTSAEVSNLTVRAEVLLARSLGKLLDRHAKPGRPVRRHRLIELLLRMREGANDPDGPAGSLAAVNAPELNAILDLYDKWRGSSVWPELQKMLCSPAEFLHTFATLALADQLRVRHPRTEVVPTTSNGKHPDLILTVTDQQQLAVEVKGRQALHERRVALGEAEALDLITRAIKDSNGQLPTNGPGMLAMGSFYLSSDDFETLERGARALMATTARQRPLLLGIALHDTSTRVVTESQGIVTVQLFQRSRLIRNPSYRGAVRIDGAWHGAWTLALS